MPVETTCPSCSKRYSLADDVAGRKVRCKACGQTFVAADSATVNAAKAEEAPELPWPQATESTPSASATGSAGNTIGRFVIRGKLGAGAFGTVYRAYDPQLDRVVALKVPNPGVMTDAKRAERFLREAKAAANLRHPHIIPVFDAGKDGDTYYIASAFIEGQPLADAIPEGGTDFTRAARIARELADALAYAHEQGIVHRDVKPANIIVDKQDRVHLMDFGLASRQDEAARLTNDGAVMGTPAYMAPEQAAGQKGEAKPTTDQYAAGVVLYELLTGTVPFTGPLPVVMHNVIHTDPESPRKRRPDVPKDLETICLKAMAKRPKERYFNCRELADDLRRWSENQPISARRMSVIERVSRWAMKEPKLAVAAAVIVLVFSMSFVVISDFARRANSARRTAESALSRAEQDAESARIAEERERLAADQTLGALGTATEERKKAVAERQKGELFRKQAEEERKTNETLRTQLVDEQKQVKTLQSQASEERQKTDKLETVVDEQKKVVDAISKTLSSVGFIFTQRAYQSLKNGNANEAKTLLQFTPMEFRGWEWHYTKKLCDGHVVDTVLKGTSTGVWSSSFSADGGLLVAVNGNGAITVWNTKSGDIVRTLRGTNITSTSISPDGTRVVTTTTTGVPRVWDVKTGNEVCTLTGHSKAPTHAAFSPDGTQIVTSSLDNSVRTWNAKTGAELLNIKTAQVFRAEFSRDGSCVFANGIGSPAKSWIWDAKTGKLLNEIKSNNKQNDGLDSGIMSFLSPDLSRVAFTNFGQIRVWDVKNNKYCSSVGVGSFSSPIFNSDGTRMVTGVGGLNKTIRIWDVGSGYELFRLEMSNFVNDLALSPDGSKFFVSLMDGKTIILDAGPLVPPKP